MMSEYKITMKAARVNAGLTQEDLANKLRVSKQTIVSWESGKTSPTVEKARQYCEACNAPYDAISFLRSSAI